MQPFQRRKIPWSQLQDTVQQIRLFRECRSIIDDLGSNWPDMDAYNRVAAQRLPSEVSVRFVEAIKGGKRRKRADASLAGYIEQIASQSQVPMRDQSVHDLFNFVTFILFPYSKTAIMQRHHHESQLRQTYTKEPGRGRTRTQDFLTLFDEGGAIAKSEDDPNFLVFGHAIYEQFIYMPQQPVRAYAWTQCLDFSHSTERLNAIDRSLAAILARDAFDKNSSVFSGVWVPMAHGLPDPRP